MAFGSSDTLKVVQFVLAALGLVFTVSSRYDYIVYIIFYVLALTYTLIMVVCILTGKSFLGSPGQAVSEVILGIMILGATLYICITCSLDIMLILAAVVGFVLPPMFFITAYEKM